MPRALRYLLPLLAALVVPLQAGALGGSGGGLAVSASLNGCGVAETGISCRVDVSWSGVEGAERYSATATLADGSVIDLGHLGSGEGGGSASVWLPYAGDGEYSVTVTAWGSDPEGLPKKVGGRDAAAEISDPVDAGSDQAEAKDGDKQREDGSGGEGGEQDGEGDGTDVTEEPAADGEEAEGEQVDPCDEVPEELKALDPVRCPEEAAAAAAAAEAAAAE